MKPSIWVIGEMLIDELPTGRQPGGAAFNVAQHLQNLGCDTRFISRVGTDADGELLLETAQRSGIDVSTIQRDPLHETGRVEVTVGEAGIPTYSIVPEVAYDHLDFSAILTESDALPDMVYFGSLIQRTIQAKKRLHAFLQSLPPSVLRLYDINFRPECTSKEILLPSLEQTDLLKLNEDEVVAAAELLGVPERGDDFLRWMMLTFNIQQLTVTRGEQGCEHYTPEGQMTYSGGSIQQDEIVDTVGAGDAFAAILAKSYLRRLFPQETLARASALAEKVCTISGAIPASPAFYDDFK